MLSPDDFNTLTETEKAEAVWQGSFLADREENGLIIQLHAVSTFYVEVFYDPAANKILSFRSFTSKHLLTPYLAHIKFNLH
ncbi:hypothetical protein [Mucilaginibacter sp. dw_454]|uniref:hypothetical protein n=1 Tax=Mucilaginibacter sp. dw_454 TaxID=2720079 RepID=UPI001BD44AA2|nr:hypothetical protein [Mucilaginibacter sp. dw_454]